MNITNAKNIQSAQPVPGLQRTTAGQAEGAKPAMPIGDSVTFSEEGLRLSTATPPAGETSKVRFDLVNRIRSEIASGSYDTPEKMDIALERMLNRVF